MSHPNYITPVGAKRLAVELDRLMTRERPKVVDEVATAAAQGDRSENAEYIYGKKRLREIDRRVQFLTKRLDAAVVVDPKERAGADQVFFGATVDVEDDEGDVRTYRIVGEDEIDADRGDISWRSPLGFALLKKRVGDSALVRRPAGETEVTIVAIRWG